MTAAGRAWVLDDLTGPATVAAGSRYAEEPLLKTDLSVTVTRWTGRRTGALLRAAAFTLRARLMSRHFDLGGRTERGLFERDLQIVTEIGATLNPIGSAAAAAAEHVAKAEKVTENIAEIREHARIEAAETTAGRRSDTRVSKAIILCTFLRVTQDGISLCRLFELLLGLLIAGIPVWMVLQRHLAISAFDFLFGGVA